MDPDNAEVGQFEAETKAHGNIDNDGEQLTVADMGTDSLENPFSVDKPIEPYEGMEFDSLDSAKDYYEAYARSKGFTMRIHNQTKSRKDGTVITQELVCSYQGFRHKKYKNRVDRILPTPDETRNGCKAIFVVSKRGENNWVVSRLVLGHSDHEFTSLKSTKFLRQKRKKSKAQLNLIDVLDKSGVNASKIMSVLATEAGGIDHVCLNESNVRNYLSGKRQKTIEKGDAQLMLTYFQEQQSKNLGFYYAIQVDSEGHLANCFWADARSRMTYKHFGDVVTFDPTYLTNRFRMPFVPFTGVNHHRQSILFGCALLWDETEETFVWLLSTWLEAMFGQLPRTIITDQDQAITNAIGRVFPKSVVHHFCMWHIMKKVPEALGRVFHEHADFKGKFSNCIHQTLTPDEFEIAWKEIVQTYKLEKNDWLNRIYSVREKWVPAYLRNIFCDGMSTTQRSESMNSYFKDYVNSSTSMSTFVLQYERALDRRYDKVREKNVKTRNSKPVFKTMHPMENQAAQVYTRKIFKLFQEELMQSQKNTSEKMSVIDGVYYYKVHEINRDNSVYTVHLNLVSAVSACTCHKFEFEGILCRHVSLVLLKKGIHTLPPHYILNRWTMNATKEKVDGFLNEELEKSESKPSTLWFNHVMVHYLGIAERATRSVGHCKRAITGLLELSSKLDLLPVENDNSSGVYVVNEGLVCSQDTNISILRDPAHVVSKGRPRSIRIKGHLEKNKKTCSICKTKGHTRPTCPILKKPSDATNMEEASNPETNQGQVSAGCSSSPSLSKGF